MKDICLAFGSTHEYFNGVTCLEEEKERGGFVNYVQAREERELPHLTRQEKN